MTEQEIIANAPEGMVTAVHNTYSDEWFYSVQSNMRSLSDIRELVALRDEVDELRAHKIKINKLLEVLQKEVYELKGGDV